MYGHPDVAWLIGILEGEGHFGYQTTHRVIVEMTDEDTINRVANIIWSIVGGNRPNIGVHPVGKRGNYDRYYTHVTGERARVLMRLVVPHMSERRRQQIWRALNKCGYVTRSDKVDLVKLLRIGEVV
jgi:hypothetical protein